MLYCIKRRINGEIVKSNLTLKEAKQWLIDESEDIDWDAEEYYFIDKEEK